MNYSDLNHNELYLHGKGDEITITYKYVNSELYKNLEHLKGVHVSEGPLVSIMRNFVFKYEQHYALHFGPSNNQADAIEFLTCLGRHVSIASIMDELKAFCCNTKISDAHSENIKELKETIASQAKQISDLQGEVSRLRNEAEPSTRTARVRMF